MHSDVTGCDEAELHSPILLLRRAAANAEHGYLASGDERLTYAELDAASNRFANFLHDLGVQKGDRVGALMANSLAFITSWFGTSKAGAVWAPVNTAYTGEWLRHQISDSDPTIFIIDEELLPVLRATPIELNRCTLLVNGRAEGVRSLDDFRSFPDLPTDFEPRPGDISHLIYTSGTTGRSKGVIVSHNYLCNYARLGRQNVPRKPGEKIYSALPLFHLAGIGHLLSTVAIGGSGQFARRFSLTTFWDEIEASGAGFVPTLGIAATLLASAPDTEASKRCFGQVRVLTGAGAPEIQKLLVERFGVQHTQAGGLGQSEGGFLTTLRGHPYRAGTCGLPTDSFEIRIVDENDQEVPRGEIGELVYRPTRPFVMSGGYWRNPEATALKSRNLWWHSGDFAKMDEDNYVYFADRGDDRLRRSGENVSSFELEAQFAEHPAISVPVVHSVPSELGDEEIKLTAVLRGQVTESQLWEWASARMPKFAVPRFIEFRDELPRNPVGKILKSELRRQGVTQQTWDARAR